MKNNPLILSLLSGLIVVLVVAGVSLLIKMNSLSEVYKKELVKSVSLSETVEELESANEVLKDRNISLNREIGRLNSDIDRLRLEVERVEKLKDTLEESLKKELMEKESKAD